MKIRTQLLVSILGILLIGFSAVILLGYTFSRSAVLSEVYKGSEQLRQKYQEHFNGYFQVSGQVALGIAQVVKVDPEITEEKVHKVLQENIKTNLEIYGTTLFFEPAPEDVGKKLFAPYYFRQGQLIKYIPSTPSFRYQEQDWYREPQKEGVPIWTEPYLDEGTNAIMTTYSVPIYNDTSFLGLATVDINLSALSKRINAIQIGRSGYAMLLSRQGVFLTHPEPDEYVLKRTIQEVAQEIDDPDFKELASLMVKGRSGYISLKDPFTQKKSHVTFGRIQSTGYSIAMFIPEDELLMSVNQLSSRIFWISIVATILIIISIIAISLQISNPIKKLSESARKIAEGELDIEIEQVTTKSEIGELTRDIKKMVQTIKKSLMVVQEEKEKFESVFATMSDGIVATDDHWKVTDFNQAAERMLDITDGSNLIQIISDQFKSNFELKDLLDYKKREKYFEIIRPESEQVKECVYSCIINTIVDPDENITAYVFTLRDITEERKEELNKNNILSMISHKLRTPITVLNNIASLFQDKLLGDLNEKQMKYIQTLMSQAHNVETLVDRLIRYVTLTSSKEEEPLQDISLASFLLELKEKTVFETHEKTLMLDWDIEPQFGILKFNRQYLKLILSELIENAIKFNRGNIVEVHISAKANLGRKIIEVRDNSNGIPSIHYKNIFDKFFQIDKDFTGNKEGVGLGLSLVKLILEQHKGSIEVHSKEGKGSTFILIFDSSNLKDKVA